MEVAVEVLLASEVGAPGVKPMAQLFKVPRTSLPVGSALVRSLGSPAAGPPTLIEVWPVMRRPYFDGLTTRHSLSFACQGLRLRRTIVVAAISLDLDDRNAVGVESLVGFFFVPVGEAVGEEQNIVGVLVVLHQEAVPRAVDWEVHYTIIVHAPLSAWSATCSGVLLELRVLGDGIAPGDEDFSRVPRRHHDSVGGRTSMP